MAWTVPSAIFFLAVGAALLVLTVAELRWPTQTRRGWLPMPTTRGDRFFVSLLCSAFLHAAWLAVSDLPLWYASLLAILLVAMLMRWG